MSKNTFQCLHIQATGTWRPDLIDTYVNIIFYRLSPLTFSFVAQLLFPSSTRMICIGIFCYLINLLTNIFIQANNHGSTQAIILHTHRHSYSHLHKYGYKVFIVRSIIKLIRIKRKKMNRLEIKSETLTMLVKEK